jgi:class 3 adenylate cyclase
MTATRRLAAIFAAGHGGRIVKTTGNGVLIEFASDSSGDARPHIAGISSNNRPRPGSFSSTRMI